MNINFIKLKQQNYEQKNLLVDSLLKRIKKNSLKEVIIATSETIEEEIDSTYDSVAIISSPMRSSFQEPDAEVQSNQPLST